MAWLENAELLRYVRSELRPARVLALVAGVVVGTVLLAVMGISAARNHAGAFNQQAYWPFLHAGIFVVSSIVLVLWTLISSAHALVGERTQRTFDFWRATKLSAGTLLIGKLFGPSLGAWLQYAAALPLLLITGALAHFHLLTVLVSYLIIALWTVALDMVALCVSTRARDGRKAQLLSLLLLAPVWLSFLPVFRFSFGIWSGLSPIHAITSWYDSNIARVLVFEHTVPTLLVTVGWCVIAIFWATLVLRRIIKFEPEQRSLFSVMQAVGMALTVQLIGYAAYYSPLAIQKVSQVAFPDMPDWQPDALLKMFLNHAWVLNFVALYLVMLVSLIGRDQLRHYFRESGAAKTFERMLSPWILSGILGLVIFAVAIWARASEFAGASVAWGHIFATGLALLLYLVVDGLFLEWCISTRMKSPVVKGLLMIGAYYGLVFAAAAALRPEDAILNPHVVRWLTPWVYGFGVDTGASGIETTAALLVPVIAAVVIGFGVQRRLQPRPARLALATNPA